MVEIVKNAQGNAKKWMEMLEENLEQNRSLQYFLNHSDELEVGPSDLPGPLPGNADNGWNPMDGISEK